MYGHRVKVTVALSGAALVVAGMVGCTVDPEPVRPSPTAVKEPTATPAPDSSPTVSAGTVTQEQAGEIVTAEYGGRVLNVESDTNGTEEVWEVEVADSSKGRIEVDVSKTTGEIVEFESDND